MIVRLDVEIVRALNEWAQSSEMIVRAFALYGIFLLGVIALVPAFRAARRVSVRAYLAGLLAFLVNLVIGFIRFRPRPFVVHPDIVKLIDKSALEKSFPSAHTTVAFALATAIFFWNKKWGTAALALALAIGLARVAAGVHYPSDILGGALLGVAAALVVRKIKL